MESNRTDLLLRASWRAFVCVGVGLAALANGGGLDGGIIGICPTSNHVAGGCIVVRAGELGVSSVLTGAVLNGAAGGPWATPLQSVEEFPVFAHSGPARRGLAAHLHAWASGSHGWWAAGSFGASGSDIMIWHANVTPGSKIAAGVTERAYHRVRIVNAEPPAWAFESGAPDDWQFLNGDMEYVRPFEWKGERFVVGSTKAFQNYPNSLGMVVWLAPVQPLEAEELGKTASFAVLEGGRVLRTGVTPVLLEHGGGLMLATRANYGRAQELQFFEGEDLHSWAKEPVFVGPKVSDGFDLRAIDGELWIASADEPDGQIRVWRKPVLGEWQQQDVAGPHPAASRLMRLWLLDSELGPRVLYRPKDTFDLLALPLK